MTKVSSVHWIAIAMLAIAGFFGAGAFSMWRESHRIASVVLAVIALVFLAVAVIAFLPGPG